MVGRLMPRSPGSRTFLWPPSPFELTMPSTRLGSRASSNRLDRSNDGQDHTVLPYAHSLVTTLSPGLVDVAERTWRDELNSAVVCTRPRAHRDYPPCPHLSCRRCRVHRKPGSRSRRPRDRPSSVSRDGRHIRQNRISVKWNILREDLTGFRCFARRAAVARRR